MHKINQIWSNTQVQQPLQTLREVQSVLNLERNKLHSEDLMVCKTRKLDDKLQQHSGRVEVHVQL